MAYAFRIVNVFTVGGDRLSGNPLCVFEDARGLSDAAMQALARQMNLSETTFILPATQTASARVRIFTPGFEMPFAGHPTLGTAHVVRALRGGGDDAVVLEMIAGDVAVRAGADATWTLRAARAPTTRPVTATRSGLARMVGVRDGAVAAEPLWVDTGVEQLVIPIATAADVRGARPDPALLEQWGYSESRPATAKPEPPDQGRGGPASAPERREAMAYLWAPDGPGRGLVRFFFTSHGAVIEDPATGSACANLGGWHVATGAQLPVALELDQGAAVGRPSRLGLRVDADRAIYVTGQVIELGRGTIDM